MKRIVSIFVSVIVALCPLAPLSYAKEYTDKNNEHIVETGYATREQAIACFIDAVGIERFKTDAKILDRFKDKGEISYAYIDEMSAAVYSGLINGYEDKSLKPQGHITRIEALVILNRSLSRTELSAWNSVEFSDTPQWAKTQVDRLSAAGIVKGYGDGTLGAQDFLTISQVNTLCERIERITGPMGDFYNYVNSEWLETTKLTDGVSSQSDVGRLDKTVNDEITDIIFSLYKRCYNDGKQFAENSNERKIITVYSAAADQGYRDKIGLKPIQPMLERIDEAKTTSDILKVMAELERNGFPTMLKVSFDPEVQGDGAYIPAVAGSYTGMDCNLFRDDDAKEHISAYRDYLKAMFEVAKVEAPEALADSAVGICKRLAEAVSITVGNTDLSQVMKTYDTRDLSDIYKGINVKKFFEEVGFSKVEKVIVYDEGLAKTVAQILTEGKIEDIKAYLKASVLDSSALYLNTDMFNAYQTYQNRLCGEALDKLPSDYATSIVQDLLGWELGGMYVDNYFSDSSKLAIDDITQKIIAEYKKLISSCTRMTPSTKNKAIEKLEKIKIYTGYPDDIEDYYRNDIILRPIEDGGSLVEYRMTYSNEYVKSCSERLMSKNQTVEDVWYLYPQTVNAMYDHSSNSITIPAGILRPPYFEASAGFEENLGGIGTVIAHEISHAFDATGAQFDENGKLSNWWTEQDRLLFEQVCIKTIEEYGRIKVGDLYIDGELTLNENLADIAGVSCVASLAGADNPKLADLFESYAKVWRIKATDEYQKLLLSTDVHSPDKIRVNRVLSNIDEFKDFYGIVEGDGMYLPEENKINIWK